MSDQQKSLKQIMDFRLEKLDQLIKMVLILIL